MMHSVVLARRPAGNPVEADFAVMSESLPEIPEGCFLTRNDYVSLDAGFRNWMNEDSGDEILPAMPLQAPVMGLVLAEVLESKHPDYAVGDKLMARFAWQTHSLSDGTDFIARLPAELEFNPSAYMGVLGDTGMSAYFGITDIAQLTSEDTVLISGAGGAVGSIAGQIAKLMGARVIGIVGSEAKAEWIRNTLGYDAAVVRSDDTSLSEAIQDACPNGVDVFFDNVGGQTLEAAITNMNHRGRLVLCGAISGYGVTPHGPNNLFELITKELSVEGFMTHFRHERYDEAREQLSQWLREGVIQSPEHRLEGIENVGKAFADLFAGENFGKTIVAL
ncbi:MAG: NADP-dependent oxidoreductase [Candidatus Pelagibacter sp.]|jgi:NADPH-dependent curcumin reductase CurA|nr:NADP-dependent oxidoreductase [Candidatus Pelagibacter sp.]MDG1931003.1 NADP-dependent oxidoreductase [Luminiphilus sp.]MDG2037103.1 NADP-dependent oxidoreductase [Luminiphilus sp.]RZO80682.1 MAG: NADP-dependent oxidoreductase [Halieaceae bacterium]